MILVALLIIVFFGILSGGSFLTANDEKDQKTKKIIERFAYLTFGCMAIGLLLLILYGIGMIWYYLCGGILIFEVASTLGDRIAYGVASIIGLGFILGIVAIFFGWNPKL